MNRHQAEEKDDGRAVESAELLMNVGVSPVTASKLAKTVDAESITAAVLEVFFRGKSGPGAVVNTLRDPIARQAALNQYRESQERERARVEAEQREAAQKKAEREARDREALGRLTKIPEKFRPAIIEYIEDCERGRRVTWAEVERTPYLANVAWSGYATQRVHKRTAELQTPAAITA